MLGHGAGGGIGAPDLVAARDAALALDVAVALVEQPYRVAGRKSPAPAAQLDVAWLAVLEALEPAAPLFVGGRSSGARVACRTAEAAGAAGVLCLAFPRPPARASRRRRGWTSSTPCAVPVLVVQGERDPFGMPPDGAGGARSSRCPGTHSLRSTGRIAEAVTDWLQPRRRRLVGCRGRCTTSA